MESPDLVPLAAAAVIAERAERTLRRWMTDGLITRHEGPVPPTGGLPPVLVSKSELLTYLATSGQKPRPAQEDDSDDEADAPPVQVQPAVPAPPPAPVQPTVQPPLITPADVEVVRLRGEVERERLAGRVRELDAQLVAANGVVALRDAEIARLVADRERERAAADQEIAAARMDTAEWRDQARRVEAELRAMRESVQGQSWWQRLLGGPTAKIQVTES